LENKREFKGSAFEQSLFRLSARMIDIAHLGANGNARCWKRNHDEDRAMQHTRIIATPFNSDARPVAAASSVRRAFLPRLAPFPIACFAGALVTDLAYWWSLDVMWERFSAWLITAGLILAGLAAVAGVIDLLSGRRMHTLGWPHAVGYVLAVLVSLINILVHSRDAYTAVVPTGLTLSALVVVILLITGWLGSTVVNREPVGVAQ
jgi:uncharacterized membrane protein